MLDKYRYLIMMAVTILPVIALALMSDLATLFAAFSNEWLIRWSIILDNHFPQEG